MPLGRLSDSLHVPSIKFKMFKRSSTQPSVSSDSRANGCSEERNARVFGGLRTVLREHEAPSRFPITQLPFELLAEIFYWYIVMIHNYRAAYLPACPTPYCWLALGHVCHAWRVVTLNNPRLSTYICMTRIECVQEMLKRSGDLPIFISETRNAKDSTDEMLKLALMHLPRIGSMSLQISNDILTSPDNPGTVQSGVGALQSLALTIWHSFYSDRSYPQTPVFPNMTFPNLLNLTWSYGNLSGIRTLLHPGLRCLSIRNSARVSSAQLLATLASLRGLEELLLRDVCVGAESTTPGPSPGHAVNLPHLRLLVLYDIESDVGTRLLHRIIYPGTAAVTLITAHTHLSSHTFFSSVIVGKLVGEGTLGAPPMPQSVYIKVGDDQLHLTFWGDVLPSDELMIHYHAKNCFKFQLSIFFDSGEVCVPRFLQQIPMSGVRSVFFAQGVMSVNSPRLDRIFAKMSLIEQLVLQYECRVMGDDPCENGSEDTGNPTEAQLELLFPRLKVLKIREFHQQHRCEAVHHAFDPCRVAHRLTAMRAKTDSPFRKLDISVRHSCSGFNSANGSCACGRYVSAREAAALPEGTGSSVSSKVSRLLQVLGHRHSSN